LGNSFPRGEAAVTVLAGWRRHRRPKDASYEPHANAVVLSGGGSLGAIQVGALQALLEAGVRPDVFVGCSVGALNAAFMALDPSPERAQELRELWLSLDRNDVFPVSRRSVVGHVVRRDMHLYEPDGVHALVSRLVPVGDLAELAVPVHVVTTDLITGHPVWWTDGDPHRVLVASASLPGLLPPVALGDSLHVDGGVTCPVPVQRAVELGAQRIWVLDVTGGSLGRRDARMNALDVLLMSFAISRYRLARLEFPATDVRSVIVMPRVELGHHELRDFSRTAEFVERGYDAGRKMLAQELVPAS
jgi:NTE family protein